MAAHNNMQPQLSGQPSHLLKQVSEAALLIDQLYTQCIEGAVPEEVLSDVQQLRSAFLELLDEQLCKVAPPWLDVPVKQQPRVPKVIIQPPAPSSGPAPGSSPGLTCTSTRPPIAVRLAVYEQQLSDLLDQQPGLLPHARATAAPAPKGNTSKQAPGKEDRDTHRRAADQEASTSTAAAAQADWPALEASSPFVSGQLACLLAEPQLCRVATDPDSALGKLESFLSQGPAEHAASKPAGRPGRAPTARQPSYRERLAAAENSLLEAEISAIKEDSLGEQLAAHTSTGTFSGAPSVFTDASLPASPLRKVAKAAGAGSSSVQESVSLQQHIHAPDNTMPEPSVAAGSASLDSAASSCSSKLDAHRPAPLARPPSPDSPTAPPTIASAGPMVPPLALPTRDHTPPQLLQQPSNHSAGGSDRSDQGRVMGHKPGLATALFPDPRAAALGARQPMDAGYGLDDRDQLMGPLQRGMAGRNTRSRAGSEHSGRDLVPRQSGGLHADGRWSTTSGSAVGSRRASDEPPPPAEFGLIPAYRGAGSSAGSGSSGGGSAAGGGAMRMALPSQQQHPMHVPGGAGAAQAASRQGPLALHLARVRSMRAVAAVATLASNTHGSLPPLPGTLSAPPAAALSAPVAAALGVSGGAGGQLPRDAHPVPPAMQPMHEAATTAMPPAEVAPARRISNGSASSKSTCEYSCDSSTSQVPEMELRKPPAARPKKKPVMPQFLRAALAQSDGLLASEHAADDGMVSSTESMHTCQTTATDATAAGSMACSSSRAPSAAADAAAAGPAGPAAAAPGAAIPAAPTLALARDGTPAGPDSALPSPYGLQTIPEGHDDSAASNVQPVASGHGSAGSAAVEVAAPHAAPPTSAAGGHTMPQNVPMGTAAGPPSEHVQTLHVPGDSLLQATAMPGPIMPAGMQPRAMVGAPAPSPPVAYGGTFMGAAAPGQRHAQHQQQLQQQQLQQGDEFASQLQSVRSAAAASMYAQQAAAPAPAMPHQHWQQQASSVPAGATQVAHAVVAATGPQGMQHPLAAMPGMVPTPGWPHHQAAPGPQLIDNTQTPPMTGQSFDFMRTQPQSEGVQPSQGQLPAVHVQPVLMSQLAGQQQPQEQVQARGPGQRRRWDTSTPPAYSQAAAILHQQPPQQQQLVQGAATPKDGDDQGDASLMRASVAERARWFAQQQQQGGTPSPAGRATPPAARTPSAAAAARGSPMPSGPATAAAGMGPWASPHAGFTSSAGLARAAPATVLPGAPITMSMAPLAGGGSPAMGPATQGMPAMMHGTSAAPMAAVHGSGQQQQRAATSSSQASCSPSAPASENGSPRAATPGTVPGMLSAPAAHAMAQGPLRPEDSAQQMAGRAASAAAAAAAAAGQGYPQRSHYPSLYTNAPGQGANGGNGPFSQPQPAAYNGAQPRPATGPAPVLPAQHSVQPRPTSPLVQLQGPRAVSPPAGMPISGLSSGMLGAGMPAGLPEAASNPGYQPQRTGPPALMRNMTMPVRMQPPHSYGVSEGGAAGGAMGAQRAVSPQHMQQQVIMGAAARLQIRNTPQQAPLWAPPGVSAEVVTRQRSVSPPPSGLPPQQSAPVGVPASAAGQMGGMQGPAHTAAVMQGQAVSPRAFRLPQQPAFQAAAAGSRGVGHAQEGHVVDASLDGLPTQHPATHPSMWQGPGPAQPQVVRELPRNIPGISVAAPTPPATAAVTAAVGHAGADGSTQATPLCTPDKPPAMGAVRGAAGGPPPPPPGPPPPPPPLVDPVVLKKGAQTPPPLQGGAGSGAGSVASNGGTPPAGVYGSLVDSIKALGAAGAHKSHLRSLSKSKAKRGAIGAARAADAAAAGGMSDASASSRSSAVSLLSQRDLAVSQARAAAQAQQFMARLRSAVPTQEDYDDGDDEQDDEY